MRPSRSPLLLVLVALAATLLPASGAAAQSVVSKPTARTLYATGPSGRFLLDGTWLFRRDPAGAGLRSGWQRRTGAAGWSAVSVPSAWNAADQSEASFAGGVGWYRRDFRLPSARRGPAWIVRFESVNYRARIWLNGHPIGAHTGAYLPFEVTLPASALHRGATNRLVIRVDSRRRGTDFPPAGLSLRGTPIGGWWNYGGLLREVYLRRVDGGDLAAVSVLPHVRCAVCTARLDYRVRVRNLGRAARRFTVRGRLDGRRFPVGSATIAPGRAATVRRSVRVPRPRLWSPSAPNLYDAPLTLSAGGRTVQRYALKTGIRSIRVVAGQLRLNGQPVHLRGVSLHEDSPDRGAAVDNTWRDRTLAWVRELGATIIRSHYPLHPYLQEQADRLGILQWSEIPVLSIKSAYLGRRSVRRAAAAELATNIAANGNHPSVAIWSIANELSSRPGSSQGTYIRDQVALAKRLDGTRPVGLAVAGYRSVACQSRYGPLDVVGINEYFGWYPGPNGQIADRTLLPEYLDKVRRCYPRKAILVTETGAEANRDGPVEEKGTFAFQQDFVDYHFGVYATKPWLSAAIYWTLQEFRVRPRWEGGNPRPSPPVHQKGVIGFDGTKKPAFANLQRIFAATRQVG
jgi:beta-galactosidase/beta-glucuronidase